MSGKEFQRDSLDFGDDEGRQVGRSQSVRARFFETDTEQIPKLSLRHRVMEKLMATMRKKAHESARDRHEESFHFGRNRGLPSADRPGFARGPRRGRRHHDPGVHSAG